MKTVFFGASKLVIPVIDVLSKNFELPLVITTEKSGNLIDFCKENKIEFLSIFEFDEKIIHTIREADAKVGIVADFGLKIPTEVMDIFPSGILNIHPSLLPKYRGPTPVQSALLNGDKQAGVSLIKIDDKIDHGEILAQEEYEISDKDNSQTLLEILFKQGALLLDQNLEDYVLGDLSPYPQNEKDVTFTKILSKQDGFIDLSNPPNKEKIENMIKAFYPWPGVWTKVEINGKETIIKLLPENMIQTEGKKAQSFKDFINGYSQGNEILKKLGLT